MTINEQFAYLAKGCVDIVRADELKKKLERAAANGQPLVVKVGFDPTAPDLHLGHTVLIRKMKHFQDLGHRVVFVIGDFTGLIGDPTGRSKTRPSLSREEIDANAETYKHQVFKILDPARTAVDFNSRWLGALGSEGWIRLAAKYNVAQMFERRDFRQRFDAGQPIGIHEFLYPLAQAYDSVALRADVELGGTDQLFNLNVGRDIMPAFGLEPQIVMTVPLLVGLDGVEKMSKSAGNYVGVSEPARVLVEKLVEQFRGRDEVMWDYFTLLTDLTPAEIDAMRLEFQQGRITPTDARYRLAEIVTSELHGSVEARDAIAHVKARQQLRLADRVEVSDSATVRMSDELAAKLGDDLPRVAAARGADGSINLARAIADLKFAPSTSEASRQIKAGGVRVNGEKVTDLKWQAPGPGRFTIVVGSRKVGVMVVE